METLAHLWMRGHLLHLLNMLSLLLIADVAIILVTILVLKLDVLLIGVFLILNLNSLDTRWCFGARCIV